MRRLKSAVGFICIATLLGLCMLPGCPKQAEDVTSQMPEPTPDPEAEPVASTGMTLEDIVARWPSSFVMTQTITKAGSDEAKVIVATVKMGDRGPEKIKTEVQKSTGLIDFAESSMCMWETGSTTAVKMQIPKEAANPYEDMDLSAKVVGEDVVDNVECWVTESTKDEAQVRTWWRKEDGLIRRTEADGTVSLIRYEQIGSVPDSEFELPEGMTVKEMDVPRQPQ